MKFIKSEDGKYINLEFVQSFIACTDQVCADFGGLEPLLLIKQVNDPKEAQAWLDNFMENFHDHIYPKSPLKTYMDLQKQICEAQLGGYKISRALESLE